MDSCHLIGLFNVGPGDWTRLVSGFLGESLCLLGSLPGLWAVSAFILHYPNSVSMGLLGTLFQGGLESGGLH